MTTGRQLRFAFASEAMTPNRFDQETMSVLRRLARGHAECWSRTETIARALGVGLRAAQLRLKRLAALGLVEPVRDAGRVAGRALRLLWLGKGTYVDRPAQRSAPEAQRPAPVPTPPPDPPMEEPIEKPQKSTSGCAAGPPPPQAQVVVTAEEKKRVESEAAKVVPSDPLFPAKAAKLAERFGPRRVRAGLEELKPKVERGQARTPIGLLHRIVADLWSLGVEPEDPAEASARARAEQEARMSAALERVNAKFAMEGR